MAVILIRMSRKQEIKICALFSLIGWNDGVFVSFIILISVQQFKKLCLPYTMCLLVIEAKTDEQSFPVGGHSLLTLLTY